MTGLITQLFEFLNTRSIRYCVVGDHRTLPWRLDSDLDIVVSSDTVGRIFGVINEFCDTVDARLIQYFQHEQTAWYFVMEWHDETRRLHLFASDICGDYYRDGRPLLQADDLLEGRILIPEGFFIPAPQKAFIYYLVKKIDKRCLSATHGSYLSGLWAEDPRGASFEIERLWCGQSAELLIKAADGDDWTQVRESIDILRKALHSRAKRDVRSRTREFARILERTRHPTGMSIAFLGPDGCGKTTVIECVERSLSPSFRQTQRYHLRPHFGRRSATLTPVTDPHGSPPRSPILSVVKLLYWWMDYTIGHLADIYPRVIRSTFVLFDRYYHDLLVDPRRYRYGGPHFLARTMLFFIPTPDLVILLEAPPEVVQERKQEITRPELERQCRVYRNMVRHLPSGFVVDASRPVGEVVSDVERVILNFLAARTARRIQAMVTRA